MHTVSEQVTQEIRQSLKSMGLAALSSDNTASLIGQLQNIAKKENCARSVIGERSHMWVVWGGVQPCMRVSRLQLHSFPVKDGLPLIPREAAHGSAVHPLVKPLTAISLCAVHTRLPVGNRLG